MTCQACFAAGYTSALVLLTIGYLAGSWHGKRLARRD